MGNMRLYNEDSLSITTVLNVFLDEYMPEANGEFVKVYLYLLRCVEDPSKKCDISSIADCFNKTENDIIRALSYWERTNVIRIDYDGNNTPIFIHLLPLDTKRNAVSLEEPKESIETITESPSDIVEVSLHDFTYEELKQICQLPEMDELIFVVERYLNSPLSSKQLNSLVSWHIDLKLSTELIIYLVEQCINKGISSFQYMERIALDWHKHGVFNPEDAKKDTERYNELYYSVLKEMGIRGRNLGESENEYLLRWVYEWHFEQSLIVEACRRTVDATHKPSFQYANKILDVWRTKNITTLDGIIALDEEHEKRQKSSSNNLPHTADFSKNNKFHNFEQRRLDYDELQNVLINKPV